MHKEEYARLVIVADKEFARLSTAVQAIFQQVTSNRLAVPTASGCATVALNLIALRQNPKKPNPKVCKSGRDFRRDLKVERPEVASMVSFAAHPGVQVVRQEWLREQQELLERIDQTLDNIDWLLARLVPQESYRDPIRQIAACAQQAWEKTNGGRAPKAKNKDDPLCRFVVEALKLIEQQKSAATVSAVLRERRRKRRDKMSN